MLKLSGNMLEDAVQVTCKLAEKFGIIQSIVVYHLLSLRN